jgi:hypothetical protein
MKYLLSDGSSSYFVRHSSKVHVRSEGGVAAADYRRDRGCSGAESHILTDGYD